VKPSIRKILNACIIAGGLASGAQAFDGYRLIDATSIPSNNASWDYVRLDAGRQHLYIGHRKESLQVFDIASKKVIRTIVKTEGSNSATLIFDMDLGISNNETGSITPFKISTGEVLSDPVKAGDEVDDSFYDPVTKRLFASVSTKDGPVLAVFELPALKPIGTIKTSSKRLDGGVMDGKGNLFINARDLAKVIKIDTKEMKVTAEWDIDKCATASGIAIDSANNRLFVGCRGKLPAMVPVMAVVDADNGKTIFTGEIGRQNDGMVYDAETKRIFTGNGVDAVIVIFEQVDKDAYKPIEALQTRPGVRTLALDPKSKRLYSVTAEGSADFGKKVNTAVGPFYPNTFFPNTFQVLTFGKN
jgi:DNA-binding beta-propeller fold protein YncE